MPLSVVHTDAAPAAIGPYSQAIVANGMVYCSGQISLRPDGSLEDGDIEAQTTQTLKNLKSVLEAAGSSLSLVTKCTVYLKDFEHFARMNAVYGRTFGDHKPARVCIQVSRLPKDALVEIDAIAVVATNKL